MDQALQRVANQRYVRSCILIDCILRSVHHDPQEIGESPLVTRTYISLRLLRSLERIQQYLSIEQEPKATVDGNPPAYWPSSGALRVEKLSARYSQVSQRYCRHSEGSKRGYCTEQHIVGWTPCSPRNIVRSQVRRARRNWWASFHIALFMSLTNSLAIVGRTGSGKAGPPFGYTPFGATDLRRRVHSL